MHFLCRAGFSFSLRDKIVSFVLWASRKGPFKDPFMSGTTHQTSVDFLTIFCNNYKFALTIIVRANSKGNFA